MPAPHFFLSYARRDKDRYLEAFYESLCNEVAVVASADKSKVGFRDQSNTEPGTDWEDALATALQNSLTCICLYSTSYFGRPYCGKEFTVFAQREQLDVEDGAFKASRKIIPVLWLKEKHLRGSKLPPLIASRIHYEITSADNDRYKLEGLRGIIRKLGRGTTYKRIVEVFAERILEEAKQPLPPLPQRPKLRDVPAAFGEAEARSDFSAELAEEASKSSGLRVPLEVLEKDSEVQTLHAYLLAFGRFDHEKPQTILDELRRVSKASGLAMLVVSPSDLKTTTAKAALRTCIDSEGWRGAVIASTRAHDGDLSDLRQAWAVPRKRANPLTLLETSADPAEALHELIPVVATMASQAMVEGESHLGAETGEPLPRLHGPGPRRR